MYIIVNKIYYNIIMIKYRESEFGYYYKKINNKITRISRKEYLKNTQTGGTDVPICIGWKYVTGEGPTDSKFPFRSFWLLPNTKGFTNIYGVKLRYIPVYISSGSNTPLSFIPLPFHGFVSIIQNDILIGFILKSNFFSEPTLFSGKTYSYIKKNIPYIEDIFNRNTSGSDIDDTDIKSFINKCRSIMGIKPFNNILKADLSKIKDKLGSLLYYENITQFLEEIVGVHKQLQDGALVYVDKYKSMKDTHGSGEDFIEHVCRTEIGDKLGYTLINNLNDLNPIISTNNASIFLSIVKNEKFNTLFDYLKNHIIAVKKLSNNDLLRLIEKLYPRSTNGIKLNIKTIIKNLTRIPTHKLEQILYSYRIDDIYEILLTHICK